MRSNIVNGRPAGLSDERRGRTADKALLVLLLLFTDAAAARQDAAIHRQLDAMVGFASQEPTLEKIIDSPKIGIITDLIAWDDDGRTIVGVAGTHGIARLDPQGRLVGDIAPVTRKGKFPRGNYSWVAFDDAPGFELISLEELASESVTLLNSDGTVRWSWDIPDDAKKAFGLPLVYPFRSLDGTSAVAVWSGTDDVLILDSAGQEVRREPWGRVNNRESVLRIRRAMSPGSMIAFGSHSGVRLRDCNGQEVAHVKLPSGNRYVNGVTGLESERNELRLLVQSTYGSKAQRYYLVHIPLEEPHSYTVVPLTGDDPSEDLLQSQFAHQLEPFGDGEKFRVNAYNRTAQSPGGPGLAGVWGVLEIRRDHAELPKRLALPSGDVPLRHLFPPRLLVVPKPDSGGEALWAASGSRLSNVIFKKR